LAEGGPDDVTVEKFAPNGGHLAAVLGALLAVGLLVAWALDPGDVALWVVPLAFLILAVIWTSTLRPRVLVQGSSLVLRNMVTTTRIPLAAVEEIVVRQVLAVRAGGKRYVCAGVGRSVRQAMLSPAMQRARRQGGGIGGFGGFTEEIGTVSAPGTIYADYVEMRLRALVKDDRDRRGLKARSPEVEALAAQTRRELAWPEIAGLAVSVLLLGLALLLS